MDIIQFIIVVICGLGIGVLSGMFGIGGGGLIVPLLHMGFGLPILAATSTSLLTIAPTGISGSIKHIRQKTVDFKVGVTLGCAGAVASVGGSFVADSLPAYMVVVLTVTVILFSVGMMVRTLIKDSKREASAHEVSLKETEAHASAATEEATGVAARAAGAHASTATEEATAVIEEASQTSTAATADALREIPLEDVPSSKSNESMKTFLIPLIIGLIAGGIAGIVGVGGGFIIVPFCVAYLGFSMKKASGTSLVAIAIIAIPGIITHAVLGHIWWWYGLAIIIGTIPGAQVGAWLIARLPERPMRFAFAGLLTFLGIMMLVQEFVF